MQVKLVGYGQYTTGEWVVAAGVSNLLEGKQVSCWTEKVDGEFCIELGSFVVAFPKEAERAWLVSDMIRMVRERTLDVERVLADGGSYHLQLLETAYPGSEVPF